VFDQFAQAMSELRKRGGLPDTAQARPLWNDLWHREVHHSTAIEGNTLVLREVEALLDQGRVVGAKELKDYMEVLGYGEAATWVYQQAGQSRDWDHEQVVTLTEVREIHQRTMGHVWEVAPHPAALAAESPGSFRQHEIAAFPGGMKPPTYPLVPSMVESWVNQVNQIGVDLSAGRQALSDGPRLVAQCHVEFERIHPFLDGNGRTGRLLLNLIMVRLGWPPVVIVKTQRRRYLSALISADAGDIDPLAEIIARAAIASMNTLLPMISGAKDLMPLSALADQSITLAALRQAAIRGRLAASLDQRGQWQSTRQAVDDYKQARYRRRST
jgi:fido (protein-threonine AMPylation protein)